MSYNNTFINNYIPDHTLPINPVKTVTRRLNIHFDTLFRENYNNQQSTDFIYKLPDPINDILSLRLSSIDIPSSWYTISEYNNNNTFIINTQRNGNTPISHTIIIPEGNYSSDELIDYLNNNFFSASNPSSDLRYIQVSNNPNSLKTIFEVDNPPLNFNFEIIFNVIDNSNINIFNIGWVMGYRNNIYSNIIYLIESEGLLDVGGNRYIYLSLEDYQTNKSNHHMVYFQNNSVNESILAKIYLYNGRFSLNITEDDPNNFTKLRKYFGPIKLSKFHIKLLDKYGNVINLNNMDFSFSLELEILYNGNNKL